MIIIIIIISRREILISRGLETLGLIDLKSGIKAL